MCKQEIVARAVASRVLFHAAHVGRQASSRTTIVLWIGSFSDRGQPVNDAIKRFHAVSSLRPLMGDMR